MGTPIVHTDLAVLFDDLLKAKWCADRGVEDCLPLIRRRPLRAGDEILAPGLQRVVAATGLSETVD
jgi:hypothetical protein